MKDVIEKRLKEKGVTWYGLTKLLNVVPIVVYRLRDRNSCNIYMLERIARRRARPAGWRLLQHYRAILPWRRH